VEYVLQNILQSIFSVAARCTNVTETVRLWVRAGRLKMDWTKPLAPRRPDDGAMGIEWRAQLPLDVTRG
jgi:hypothetical protein